MGYCWPCVSLQGGVYFAASCHICVGLFMTGYLVYYHLQSIAHYYTGNVSTTADGFFTICFIYAVMVLILGLWTFSGLERRSARSLKVSAICFGILHGVIFLRVVYVIISELVLSLTNVDSSYAKVGDTSSFGIVFFTFLFFTSVIYLAIMTIYIRNLQAENSSGNIFRQIQLGVGGGDGNPLYAYNTVQCHA